VQRVSPTGEGLEPADTHRAEHIPCTFEGLTPFCGGLDADLEAVLVDVPLAQLADHFEVVGIDVGESHFEVVKLGNGQKVTQQGSGEADAAGSDESNFEVHRMRLSVKRVFALS